MNNMGYQLLELNKIEDAVVVFLRNSVDHPESWNVWDSLAEGYMDKGDKASAIKYYQKSLALNPGNTNAAQQLKKLKP